MGDNVIHFPVRWEDDQKRRCAHCKNGYLGACGVICGEFMEFVTSDEVAEECMYFDGWE